MPAAPVCRHCPASPRGGGDLPGENHCSQESVAGRALSYRRRTTLGLNASCPPHWHRPEGACFCHPAVPRPGIHCAQCCPPFSCVLPCLGSSWLAPGWPPPSWVVPRWLENFRLEGTPFTFPKRGRWGPRERGLAQPLTSVGSEFEPRYLTSVPPPPPTPPIPNTKGPLCS